MKLWCIGLGLLTIGLLACEDDEAYQAKVDRAIRIALDERIAEFERSQRKDCDSRILERARQRADSIILAEARDASLQKGKPPKPEKPELPELKTLSDTSAVKPVHSDSLRKTDINSKK